MTDDRYPYRHQETTPDSIWVCTHLGEYGKYYPEAVEAEGEYGGTAVEYVPKQAKPEGTEDLQKQRDSTDPRALVDESNRHRPARELLQGHTIQDSLADALTAALDRAEKAEAERDALKAAKWDVQHTDTMNEIVQMGMARDTAWNDAIEAAAIIYEEHFGTLAKLIRALKKGAKP